MSNNNNNNYKPLTQFQRLHILTNEIVEAHNTIMELHKEKEELRSQLEVKNCIIENLEEEIRKLHKLQFNECLDELADTAKTMFM